MRVNLSNCADGKARNRQSGPAGVKSQRYDRRAQCAVRRWAGRGPEDEAFCPGDRSPQFVGNEGMSVRSLHELSKAAQTQTFRTKGT